MPFITVGRENSGEIRLHYEDHGAGPSVIMVHGYLADGYSWEKQETAFLAAGYRVITYDRRGSGQSSRPSSGYDYDTLAADLAILVDQLKLREVMLVGFGMGTGEVIRYLAAHGSGRVSRAALIAPLPPFLPRGPGNPEGIDRGIFTRFTADLLADRPARTKAFVDDCYNLDQLGGPRVSDQAWQNTFYTAIRTTLPAAVGCVAAWQEDFRADVAGITVPVLVIQGDQDRLLPPGATGNRLPALLSDARHVLIRGGPHAITWTHAVEVNRRLLSFVAAR
ncbi:MAG TPA: alpha/beta hydrolase [Streptosporangiaceae bacterium]